MIKYTLKCPEGHRFESWFQSSDAHDRLVASGHVACSVCGNTKVEKAIMAPRVAAKANGKAEGQPAETRPLSGPASPAEAALRQMREKFESVAENVGRDFVDEARAIHVGDAPERPIYGEARLEEARSLVKDGIKVAPLPWTTGKTN